jgi:hypothetical protein
VLRATNDETVTGVMRVNREGNAFGVRLERSKRAKRVEREYRHATKRGFYNDRM